jgi:1-acyl-sn-glycerol-3-phosphate acyltransferase
MSVTSSLSRTAAVSAGFARMLEAVSADALHRVDPRRLTGGGPKVDPLDLRDPEYIRRTLPTLRAMSELYFRAEVRGLEHIPAEGPVLLVGNHSGGTLIADTFVFGQAFYDRFGPERTFHQLAHDLVFKVPGIPGFLSPYGTVPANPENARRALERDAAVLVYPGGDHETYRASWEEAEIEFAHRMGFARIALAAGVPIVPVVAIGGQETALFLGQGERIARLLHLHELLRLDVVPIQIAPPWGITVLDLPGRIPLPAKITIEVLPAIDVPPAAGAEEAYEIVTERMQTKLDRLAEQRRYPLVG